ncbi:hypothetical protein FKM82_003155 [Ascaphus truei]
MNVLAAIKSITAPSSVSARTGRITSTSADRHPRSLFMLRRSTSPRKGQFDSLYVPANQSGTEQAGTSISSMELKGLLLTGRQEETKLGVEGWRKVKVRKLVTPSSVASSGDQWRGPTKVALSL